MTKDETYMALAKTISKRSKCSRLSEGSVIVKNGKLISHGFNGVPKELKKCKTDKVCFSQKNMRKEINDLDQCMSIHAIQFAIINAGNREFPKYESNDSLSGSTIYATHQPCLECCLFIIAADIVRVVYDIEYPDKIGLDLLKKATIKVEKYNKNIYH